MYVISNSIVGNRSTKVGIAMALTAAVINLINFFSFNQMNT